MFKRGKALVILSYLVIKVGLILIVLVREPRTVISSVKQMDVCR